MFGNRKTKKNETSSQDTIPYYISALLKKNKIPSPVVINKQVNYCFPSSVNPKISRLLGNIPVRPPSDSGIMIVKNAFSPLENVIDVKFIEQTRNCSVPLIFVDGLGKAAIALGNLIVLEEKYFRLFEADSKNTAIHEISHVLGMDHPTNAWLWMYIRSEAEPPHLPLSESNYDYTHMAYVPSYQALLDLRLMTFPDTPMIYDIAALQAVYGVNTNYNSGDTLYRFSCDKNRLFTIWDPSGNDSLIAQECATNNIINLDSGKILNRVGNNFFKIAFDSEIENVFSGEGHDIIFGNHLNNIIHAGSGNDQIYPGSGNATIITGLGHDIVYATSQNSLIIIKDYTRDDSFSLVSLSNDFNCTALAPEVFTNRVNECKTIVTINSNFCEKKFYPKKIIIENYCDEKINFINQFTLLDALFHFLYYPNNIPELYIYLFLTIAAIVLGACYPEIEKTSQKLAQNLEWKKDCETEMLEMLGRIVIRGHLPLAPCLAYDISKAMRLRRDDYRKLHLDTTFQSNIKQNLYSLLGIFEICTLYLAAPLVTVFITMFISLFSNSTEAWKKTNNKPFSERSKCVFFKGIEGASTTFLKSIPGGHVLHNSLEKQDEAFNEYENLRENVTRCIIFV